MHAKMTRDRKKNFICCVEKTIAQLERDNQKMRDTLKLQVQNDENSKISRNFFEQDSLKAVNFSGPNIIESNEATRLESIVASSVAKAIQNQKSKELSTTVESVGFQLIA